MRDAWYGFQVLLNADWRRPAEEEPTHAWGENRCVKLRHAFDTAYGRKHRSVDSEHLGAYGDVGGGVIHSSLCRDTGPLVANRSLVQNVDFKLHCDVHVAGGTFVTLIDSVLLRIFAGSRAAVHAALGLAPPASASAAPTAEPPPVPPGTAPPAAPAVEPRAPGALSVPPLVIPANDSARKLVAEIVEGRVRHLGLHLSTLPRAELKRIAAGLRAEAEAADEVALAEAIARRLTAGAG